MGIASHNNSNLFPALGFDLTIFINDHFSIDREVLTTRPSWPVMQRQSYTQNDILPANHRWKTYLLRTQQIDAVTFCASSMLHIFYAYTKSYNSQRENIELLRRQSDQTSLTYLRILPNKLWFDHLDDFVHHFIILSFCVQRCATRSSSSALLCSLST